VNNKKYYTAFKKNRNFCTLQTQTNKIRIWLSLDKSDLNDPKESIIDVSNIGHHGTGNSQIDIISKEDIPYVLEMIKECYESDEDAESYDLEYLKERMNNETYNLFIKFRERLLPLNQYINEKINKYFVGYRTHGNYFLIVRPRKKFFYIRLKFLPKNLPNLPTSYEVSESNKRVQIKIESEDELDNPVQIIKEYLI